VEEIGGVGLGVVEDGVVRRLALEAVRDGLEGASAAEYSAATLGPSEKSTRSGPARPPGPVSVRTSTRSAATKLRSTAWRTPSTV